MNEVHEADPGVPAEMGLERPHGAAAADRLVRTLFRLRGLRRAVPLKRFAIEILGLRFVECTHTYDGGRRGPHTPATCGRRDRGSETALSGGSRLITETRGANVDLLGTSTPSVR